MRIDDQASTIIVEGFDCTHGQPLSVIALGGGEESLEGVVGGDDEAGGVDEELSGNVEEDKEEVEGAEAENNVDLGDVGLLLKLLQLRVLGQLLVELGQVELRCSGGQSGRDAMRCVGEATTVAALAAADSCDERDCGCDYATTTTYPCPGWNLLGRSYWRSAGVVGVMRYVGEEVQRFGTGCLDWSLDARGGVIAGGERSKQTATVRLLRRAQLTFFLAAPLIA